VGGLRAGLGCAQNADCPGGVCRLKNRFITAITPPTATSHGIKVKLITIDANSVATPPNYDGTDRWVGTPTLGVNDGVSPPFNAAKIQCTPLSMNWSAVGQLHMYGDVIVPLSLYDVSSCNPPTNCSSALRIETARFGDVIVPTPTVNFQDVDSIVKKFQGHPSGPSKTRTKLTNSTVNPANPVNFQEVSAGVSAFQSKPFKLVVTAPPVICPVDLGCCDQGACCVAGNCDGTGNLLDCLNQGGTFLGEGTTCAIGACAPANKCKYTTPGPFAPVGGCPGPCHAGGAVACSVDTCPPEVCPAVGVAVVISYACPVGAVGTCEAAGVSAGCVACP